MHAFLASIRLTIVTLAVCVAGYTAVVLGIAQVFTPDTAEGSLVTIHGKVVGSRLVAQKFTRAGYFWPRPSAADYNAAGAGGSNKSPTSPDLTDRARQIVEHYGATAENPLPAEFAAASGGGLDPHITEHAAMYQAARVAKARSFPPAQLEDLIRRRAFAPGGAFVPDRLVNVFELNLALDAVAKAPAPAAAP